MPGGWPLYRVGKLGACCAGPARSRGGLGLWAGQQLLALWFLWPILVCLWVLFAFSLKLPSVLSDSWLFLCLAFIFSPSIPSSLPPLLFSVYFTTELAQAHGLENNAFIYKVSFQFKAPVCILPNTLFMFTHTYDSVLPFYTNDSLLNIFLQHVSWRLFHIPFTSGFIAPVY